MLSRSPEGGRMPLRSLALALCLLASLAPLAPAQSRKKTAKLPAGPIVEGELGKRLDQHLLALDRDAGGFCGAALVAVDGVIVLEKGYGVADADSGKPIAHDALFDWASISKQFTAAAVLKLEMAKKLALDDRLTEHFGDVPEDKREITLEQMLCHTSGLQKGFRPEWKWDPTRRESMFELVLGLPVESKPGSRFEYNNTPYGFLAALVEEISGDSFEDYCIAELYRPAGMASAGFIGHPELDAARVPRDDRGRGAPFPYGPVLNWGYRGCGGAVASVREMFLWDRALRGDKVLSKSAKQKMFTPRLEGYALGWYVGPDVRGTRVEHGGDTRATTSYFGRWIEEDIVVLLAYTYKPAVYKFETGRALAQIARRKDAQR
jgi:CubicO group peptidase (beta-lactamase class C family)